jgi:hypothetical protein
MRRLNTCNVRVDAQLSISLFFKRQPLLATKTPGKGRRVLDFIITLCAVYSIILLEYGIKRTQNSLTLKKKVVAARFSRTLQATSLGEFPNSQLFVVAFSLKFIQPQPSNMPLHFRAHSNKVSVDVVFIFAAGMAQPAPHPGKV